MKAVLLVVLLAAAQTGAALAADATEANAAWGLPLFPAEGTLWDEDAAAVAARLGLPEESRTSDTSSYRLYPREDARVLGRRPYSIALSAENGRPVALSIIFANKGDSVGQFARTGPGSRAQPLSTAASREYKKAIADDEEALDAVLAQIAGEAVPERTAQGGKMNERAKRRDWGGHAVLLVSARDEYVAVRVVPPASLDDAKAAARVPAAELRERLARHVERRPNGDVVLRDLPMVDQGPKGFCVPATMERMLRHLGIPADMYLLAMAANTRPGGGTTIPDLLWAVGDTVRRHGRRVQSEAGKPDLNRVARWIESGLPVLWGINTSREMDQRITGHTKRRADVTDWAAWASGLEPARREARKLARTNDEGHVCLIIGFNRATGELALSDSWGPGYEERWITVEEAAAISQGSMAVVSW
jgi:hypothetical protein